ncbi:MAG: hypothetical protein ABIH83_01990 [Candidatus Micrarchaeota archaeon]
MASPSSVSHLPSGFKGRKASKLSFSGNKPKFKPDTTTFLAIIAILLSLTSIFLNITSPPGLSTQDRAELMAIAQDLREIQQKEIVMTSPLKTTVVIDQSFPISDVFPEDFVLKIDQTIPIDSELTARSNTGQIVQLTVLDGLRIKADIPLDPEKATEGQEITINKEMPIDTRFSATLKVNAVYGKELNDMITRIENLAQKGEE